MLENRPIGDIVFKDIDLGKKCCTMGIHLANDSVKNKGYGTQAEVLALKYAFEEMDIEIVYANVLRNNKRSQHVRQKAGFVQIAQDESFYYYECRKPCL